MGEILIEKREGQVAWLTLNRPDSLNALDSDLMRELVGRVRELAEDDDVGCVVLTGSGRAFCAGGDVKAIGTASTDRTDRQTPSRSTTEKRVRWLRRSVEASRLLHEMPKPTIAMINGACAGAGMSLAAACDLRLAGKSAVFRPAFSTLGMPGDYGGSWLWSKILGAGKVRQLYMVDKKRDADAALDFGLVHEVHEDDALRDYVAELAARLAKLPATGFAYAKDNLNHALYESFAQSLDRESRNMMLARNALIEVRKDKKAAEQEKNR